MSARSSRIASPVRAMVMAAGAGTRLRPLTYDVPKPMVPVANRPVLEYTVENLRRHGVREIIFNLYSHPRMIRRHFGDGSRFGVSIAYSPEKSLMGTAGGVKRVEWFLEGGTFLVTSGDGLTRADFTRLLQFHRRRRSIATMGLKAVDTRFDYGVTIVGRGGRIRRFVEKPMWSQVFSNQVNTGIYVFEPRVLRRIPAGRVVDFGHQVWPAMLRDRLPIFGFELAEYWCDVGNLSEYRRAQRDMLDGRVGFALPGTRVRPGVYIEPGAVIHPGARLRGPCLIGRNCRIGRGAVIDPYTIIGHDAVIAEKARVSHSTLWDRVRVDRGVKLQNCIIGHGARVQANISVFEGSVIQLNHEP